MSYVHTGKVMDTILLQCNAQKAWAAHSWNKIKTVDGGGTAPGTPQKTKNDFFINNTLWFQLLHCEDLLLFYHFKLNLFGF